MLGTADLPGVSAIASAVAESAAQDKIPWSALDYSGQAITSISGSAIGGQVDTSQFYPTSNPSGFITGVDLSDYAKESSLSSVSSVVSSIQEDVSSISGQISGLTGVYLEQSASSLFAPSGDYLSATDSGNFYPMTGNPSSFVQSGELSAYAKESAVSSKLDASASSLFAPSGDYAFNSSVSGKLDASASSLFAPSGDYAYNSALSGYIPTSASSSFMPSGDYQTAGDYAYNSAVSSKLDASASSEFYLTSNPSGFITGVDLSEYQEKSGMSAYQLTADMSAYQPSGDYAYASSVSALDYSGINPVVVDNEGRTIGINAKMLDIDSTMTSYESGGITYFGVNESALDISGQLSSKLDASASSLFQPSGDYENKLTWQYKLSGGSSFITSVNNSAFSAGNSINILTSTLVAETGLKITISGDSAILSLDTVGSGNSITGIGASGLNSVFMHQSLSIGDLSSTTFDTGPSSRFWYGGSDGIGVESRRRKAYTKLWDSASGSGSSNTISTVYIHMFGHDDSLGTNFDQWATAYIPGASISPLPTATPPSSVSVTLETGSGAISANAVGFNYTAYLISGIDYTYSTGSAVAKYSLGDPIPYGCGVAVRGNYGGGQLYNPSATASAYKEWNVVEGQGNRIVAYVPSGQYLEVNADTFSLTGLSSNYCTLNNFRLASSFNATAQSMVVPLTAGQQVPTGSASNEIHWTGIVDTPYNAKWYLVEGISGSPDEVIAFDYVPSGTSVVRLNGITYGKGNYSVCTGISASAVFDSSPNNEQITVLDQHGEYHKVTVGTLFGG